jgi:transketolase
MALRAGTFHVASALSIAEILGVLYGDVLRHPAGRPDGTPGDRFLLSKGHAAPALYGAIAHAGILDRERVEEYCSAGDTLPGHPELGLDAEAIAAAGHALLGLRAA